MTINLNVEQAKFIYDGLGIKVPVGKDFEIDEDTREKMATYSMDTESFEAMDAEDEGREISPKGRIAMQIADMVF